jgi:hypothetical protein
MWMYCGCCCCCCRSSERVIGGVVIRDSFLGDTLGILFQVFDSHTRSFFIPLHFCWIEVYISIVWLQNWTNYWLDIRQATTVDWFTPLRRPIALKNVTQQKTSPLSTLLSNKLFPIPRISSNVWRMFNYLIRLRFPIYKLSDTFFCRVSHSHQKFLWIGFVNIAIRFVRIISATFTPLMIIFNDGTLFEFFTTTTLREKSHQ